MSKKNPDYKEIAIGYSLFNNPKKSKIKKVVNKHLKDGYQLTSRTEDKPGCLKLLFTFGWARGKTNLTFTRH